MNEALRPTPIARGTAEGLATPMVSNLQRVEGILQTNYKKIFVAGSLSHYSPDQVVYYQGEPLIKLVNDLYGKPREIDASFFVAPRKNGEFNPKKLENFRKGVVKLLSPVSNQVEIDTGFGRLRYGMISFVDKLATVSKTETRVVEEIEPGSLNGTGLEVGKKDSNSTDTFNRIVFVVVVPHPMLAVILRNEVQWEIGNYAKFAKDLKRTISNAQLETLKEQLKNQYSHPKHILHELITTAEAEHYKTIEEEIHRFRKIYNR